MAIELTAAVIETVTGFDLTSCHIRIEATFPQSEDQLLLRTSIFKDEAAFLAGDQPITLKDYPGFVLSMVVPMTPGQYTNIDMEATQQQYASLLQLGEAHPQWDVFFPGQFFGGVDGTYTIVMPT